MILDINFVGPSYEDRSVDVSAQKCINLFPTKDGERPALYGTPGLKLLGTAGSGPIREVYEMNGKLYVVSGNEFYHINKTDYSAQLIGILSRLDGKPSIADDGNKMLIGDGNRAFVFDPSATRNNLISLSNTDFKAATTVVYMNNFFIRHDKDSVSFRTNTLGDIMTWPALDFDNADRDPDPITTLISDHNELWLFGKRSAEVWYYSGNANFPFSKVPGAYIEMGCAAARSVAKADNTIYWLAHNNEGGRTIVMAKGYSPAIISTRAIEYKLDSYAVVDDAIAYTYKQEGRTFYVLTFPTEDVTWVYDASSRLWHQRKSYGMGRHLSNCHVFWENKHIVGDYKNGNFYEMDMDTFSDNGTDIERIKTSSHIEMDGLTLFHNSLELMVETGNVSTSQNPVARLSYSDDRGHSWSNEMWNDLGKIGEFYRRSKWYRLGSARSRVYKLRMSDAIRTVILGAKLDVMKGTH